MTVLLGLITTDKKHAHNYLSQPLRRKHYLVSLKFLLLLPLMFLHTQQHVTRRSKACVRISNG